MCAVYRWSVTQMLTEIHLEMATWQLLHVLYTDRVMAGGEDMMEEEEGRASDKEIMEKLFARDSSVRHAQVRTYSIFLFSE